MVGVGSGKHLGYCAICRNTIRVKGWFVYVDSYSTHYMGPASFSAIVLRYLVLFF